MAKITDEHVKPYRDRLQRHKKHHEIVALHHQHHSRRQHQRDMVKLRFRDLKPRQNDFPEVTNAQSAQQKKRPHALPEQIVPQHSRKRRFPQISSAVRVRKNSEPNQNRRQSPDRHPRDQPLFLPRKKHLKDQQTQRQKRHQHLGQNRPPNIGGRRLFKNLKILLIHVFSAPKN